MSIEETTTTQEELVQVIREGQCPSVSGRSTLTYHLGQLGEGEFHVRIWSNTGRGMFARDWIPMDAIGRVIDGADDLTSNALKPLYAGRSINTAGFLLAVLRHLELIVPNPANTRLHVRNLDVSLESVLVPGTAPTPTRGRRKQKGG